ncbi:NAD(P)-dependent oxidoreductase [Paenibacillus urinalis]|uniref:NAD(P)-dependent oxidoreductase n=1 Tax=Paenibacillus urinalis TaxID=521520 RepID=UPI00195F3EC9
MNIGVIGASGKAGRLVAKEAAVRGHNVTAIVRDASKVSEFPVIEKDVFHITAEDVQGLDVIVNAFGAALGQEHLYVEAGQALIRLLSNTDIRLIVVGGAGSLYVDDQRTTQLVDTPEFPAEIKPTASNAAKNLEDLKASEGLNWTYMSPAAFFDPEGKRTGSYQLGQDNLILNSQGNSYISYEDYAVALVDEIEAAQHKHKRFTVVAEQS